MFAVCFIFEILVLLPFPLSPFTLSLIPSSPLSSPVLTPPQHLIPAPPGGWVSSVGCKSDDSPAAGWTAVRHGVSTSRHFYFHNIMSSSSCPNGGDSAVWARGAPRVVIERHQMLSQARLFTAEKNGGMDGKLRQCLQKNAERKSEPLLIWWSDCPTFLGGSKPVGQIVYLKKKKSTTSLLIMFNLFLYWVDLEPVWSSKTMASGCVFFKLKAEASLCSLTLGCIRWHVPRL